MTQHLKRNLHRVISNWLYKATRNRPVRFIMLDGKPYIERYWLGKLFGWTFYLHRYLGADGDRNLHDHPWRQSYGLILCGAYTENRLLGLDPYDGFVQEERTYRLGNLNRLGMASFHRITYVHPWTWTLFFHSTRIKEWGFLLRTSDLQADQRPNLPYAELGVLYHPYLHNGKPGPYLQDWHLAAPLAQFSNRCRVNWWDSIRET